VANGIAWPSSAASTRAVAQALHREHAAIDAGVIAASNFDFESIERSGRYRPLRLIQPLELRHAT
jgi:hypothetical protein